MDIDGGEAVGQFLIGIGVSCIFFLNQLSHFLPDGLIRNFPFSPAVSPVGLGKEILYGIGPAVKENISAMTDTAHCRRA